MKLKTAFALLSLTFAASAFSMASPNPDDNEYRLTQSIEKELYDFDEFNANTKAQEKRWLNNASAMAPKELEHIKMRHTQMEGRTQNETPPSMRPMQPMMPMQRMHPAPMSVVVMPPPAPPAITTMSIEGLAKISKPAKKAKGADDAAAVTKQITEATLSAIDQIRTVAEETSKKTGGEYRILHLETEEDGDFIRAQGKVVIIKKN